MPEMHATETSSLRHVATFCGQCNCGCPELYLDPDADAERRVVITDDFGQRIQMSLEQLAVIVDDARRGVLDDLLAGVTGVSAFWSVWSAVFVGAALLCAVSLVRHRHGHDAGTAAEANHVVMAVAMAVMAAPGGMTLVPPTLGAAAFAVCGAAWLARLLLAGRRGEPLGSPIGHVRCSAHPTHLFLVNAAMVAMYVPMLGAHADADGGQSEHAGHGGGGGGGLALGVLDVLLAVYLLVHAVATVAALVARARRDAAPEVSASSVPGSSVPAASVPPEPAAGSGVATLAAPATRTGTRVDALAAPRVQLVCQAVMGVGMAVMLLWMH